MADLPNRSRSIEGRVAVITGAASGMGRAMARLFASEGAKVAVTDLDLAACETVAGECGENARAYALDVSHKDAIEEIVGRIAEDFGGIDILVNNAGISAFCALDAGEEYEEIWHHALAVMLTAHQRMVRAALPPCARAMRPASSTSHPPKGSARRRVIRPMSPQKPA